MQINPFSPEEQHLLEQLYVKKKGDDVVLKYGPKSKMHAIRGKLGASYEYGWENIKHHDFTKVKFDGLSESEVNKITSLINKAKFHDRPNKQLDEAKEALRKKIVELPKTTHASLLEHANTKKKFFVEEEHQEFSAPLSLRDLLSLYETEKLQKVCHEEITFALNKNPALSLTLLPHAKHPKLKELLLDRVIFWLHTETNHNFRQQLFEAFSKEFNISDPTILLELERMGIIQHDAEKRANLLKEVKILAESNIPRAQYLMGELSFDKKWYQKAAEQQFAPAMHFLGRYEKAQELGYIPSQFFVNVREAAMNGYTPAQLAHAKDRAKERDYVRAEFYLEKAVEKGDQEALRLLIDLLKEQNKNPALFESLSEVLNVPHQPTEFEVKRQLSECKDANDLRKIIESTPKEILVRLVQKKSFLG